MIRPATLADCDALVEGNLAMALETEGLVLDRDTLERGVRRVLAGEADAFYRVVDQRGVIAQLMVTREWSDWRAAWVWWIQSVYVLPQHRGRGLYRALYASLREEAASADVAGLRLYVDRRNTAAQQVYERLGMDAGHYVLYEAMADRDAASGEA